MDSFLLGCFLIFLTNVAGEGVSDIWDMLDMVERRLSNMVESERRSAGDDLDCSTYGSEFTLFRNLVP